MTIPDTCIITSGIAVLAALGAVVFGSIATRNANQARKGYLDARERADTAAREYMQAMDSIRRDAPPH